MAQTEYVVRTGLYEGPLDLLLYLVRRSEIDPVQLRISQITQQFLEYLEVLKVLDLDLIGDFVVMASTLVELKSRLVLPQPEAAETSDDAVEDESGSGLVLQLLQYKQFKDAARQLEEGAQEWQERYPRLTNDRPVIGKDPSADRIREVELWDLVSALSRILQRHAVEEESSIRYDDTPIGVYSERIRKRLEVAERVRFSDFFEGEKVHSRIVGLFLAILELLRHHGYRAEQSTSYGDIWVMRPLVGATSTETTDSGSAEKEDAGDDAGIGH